MVVYDAGRSTEEPKLRKEYGAVGFCGKFFSQLIFP
jgi:hypothetical protein